MQAAFGWSLTSLVCGFESSAIGVVDAIHPTFGETFVNVDLHQRQQNVFVFLRRPNRARQNCFSALHNPKLPLLVCFTSFAWNIKEVLAALRLEVEFSS